MLRRGLCRAVLSAHRPVAASLASASGQQRSLAMMVNADCIKQLNQKVIDEPHVDAMKLKTDDAEPVRFTYKQLNRQVTAFAKGLVGTQFTPGSKFVVWTKDIAEGIVAQMAALKVGLKVVVLDASATEADLAKAMVDARALLFSPTLLPNNATLTMVKNLVPEVEDNDADGNKIIYSPDHPKLRWIMTTGHYGKKGMVKFQHVACLDDPFPLPEVSVGSIALAGPGTPNLLKSLPFVDSTVTFEIDDDKFADC